MAASQTSSGMQVAFLLLQQNIQKHHGYERWKFSQRAKKVVSDSPGLVDFAIGLVIFVLNLPDVQVLFLGENQIREGL